MTELIVKGEGVEVVASLQGQQSSHDSDFGSLGRENTHTHIPSEEEEPGD